MMTERQVDFAALESRAASMTLAELAYCRREAHDAAENLKGVRGFGACKGENYYRDECSVYGAEMRRRGMA